jgi:uncharacterized membrane-anchored protein
MGNSCWHENRIFGEKSVKNWRGNETDRYLFFDCFASPPSFFVLIEIQLKSTNKQTTIPLGAFIKAHLHHDMPERQ